MGNIGKRVADMKIKNFGLSALVLGFTLTGVMGVHASPRIIADGSSGVKPLVEALAKAYKKMHPEVKIEIGKGMKSKKRIQALAKGVINIAMASHGLNIEKIEKQGMKVHRIAKMAIVFGVNKSVGITNITDAQVCGIYIGRLRNWKQLGQPAQPLVALTRPDSEVDVEVARAQIECLKNLRMAKNVQVMPKSGKMARKLAKTPGAIGMTTMVRVLQSKGKIKPLSLNGAAPSPKNMMTRKYTLTREAFVVTKAKPAPAVAKFLSFIRREMGKKLIIQNDAVAAE